MSILYSEDLYWVEDIKRCHYQITKISSSDLDVVNLYGSDGADTDQFLEDLFCLISCKETFKYEECVRTSIISDGCDFLC